MTGSVGTQEPPPPAAIRRANIAPVGCATYRYLPACLQEKTPEKTLVMANARPLAQLALHAAAATHAAASALSGLCGFAGVVGSLLVSSILSTESPPVNC